MLRNDASPLLASDVWKQTKKTRACARACTERGSLSDLLIARVRARWRAQELESTLVKDSYWKGSAARTANRCR